MVMQTTHPTTTACEIARIDRDRFNEAVARGTYPCAPEVVAGASRIFDFNDLAALVYYGQLLTLEYPPRMAGALACAVLKAQRQNPDAPFVYIRQMPDGKLELSYAVENLRKAAPPIEIISGKNKGKFARFYLLGVHYIRVDLEMLRGQTDRDIRAFYDPKEEIFVD